MSKKRSKGKHTKSTERGRCLEDAGLVEAILRSQAVIEFTLDGVVLDANENFVRLLGYTRADVVGQHHRMFVDPAYAGSEEYRAFWAKLQRGDGHAGEFRRLGREGREVWIQGTWPRCSTATGAP
ncbi:MAG: PAS domain-containing protein [Polyangiales bacterium]